MSRRTEANKANAQLSTGPTSEAGKKTSSLNALRHGLTGQVVIMPHDDLLAYRRHVQSFIDEYQPSGASEEHLVQSLADTAWRLNRAAALESNVLALNATGADKLDNALSVAAALESQTKALSNLSMHSQRLSRQFERTLALLRTIQTQRRDTEEQQLSDLLDVIEMQQTKEEPFDPEEYGFVFSEDQIATASQSRARQNLIDDAFDFLEEAA
jgi:hypothetical protein